MLYAMIALVCVLVIFVIISFFLMKKTYDFKIEDKNIIVKNIGSNIKVYEDEKLLAQVSYPDLINGEKIDLKLNEKLYTIVCKSGRMGYKIRIEIFHESKLICDNGVILKEKNKNKNS